LEDRRRLVLGTGGGCDGEAKHRKGSKTDHVALWKMLM
jgi:hypothetical protein